MKFGLLVVQKTDNIGDDIQSYAALRFLPHIEFYIDRERLDAFHGDNDNQKVAVIMNAWYMYTKFNWPPSPYIYPLFIAMHISKKDYYGIGTRFLDGVGGEYLKRYEPIGARDQSTNEILSEKGIESYVSGCLTMTLNQYENIKKSDIVYLVDLDPDQVKKIKEYYPNEHFEEVTHSVDYSDNFDYEERMLKVEELLKKYQSAKCVITSRLHCALPCLALETPVLLVYKDDFKDRIGYFLQYVYSVTSSEIQNNQFDFDISNPPKNREKYLLLRESIIEKCNKFIAECEDKKIACEEIEFYKIIKWQDDLINDVEVKFRRQILDCQSWCDELQQGKDWIEGQYNNIKSENERLQSWCNELQQGKTWLEEQYSNIKSENEKLQSWCNELQQGKDWIEKQWDHKCRECEELKEKLQNERENN